MMWTFITLAIILFRFHLFAPARHELRQHYFISCGPRTFFFGLASDICNLHLSHFAAIHEQNMRHKKKEYSIDWTDPHKQNAIYIDRLIQFFGASEWPCPRYHSHGMSRGWYNCNCKLRNALTKTEVIQCEWDAQRYGRCPENMNQYIMPRKSHLFSHCFFFAHLTRIALSADASICIDRQLIHNYLNIP